uniref:Vacuolar protein sorting-associated protein 51 homolog n=1 Tax=Romanomermis culicivorax TaxID=13658 RepID=A0A915JUN8_ROMCU
MSDLKEHLKDSLRENLITTKELATNVALLMQLGERPENLAEEYSQHIYKSLNLELDTLQTSCEHDQADIFQFIDSDCSTFLSNIGLMIVSCRDLFPNIDLDIDDKVDNLLKRLLTCIENRFVAENQKNSNVDAAILTSPVSNGIDCVLITRALDRFYRRIQATGRMIPQSISKDQKSKSENFGAYEKLAYQIVVNVCRLQVTAAADFVKKRF